MLDLNDWIPEEISGVRISKKTTSKKIIISGKYANDRPFHLLLNRYIDDQLFTFGCGLFAGEGTKGGKGTPFEFANSNPRIVGVVMKLLHNLGIDKSTISPRLQLRLIAGESTSRVQKLLEFWSEYLGIPLSQFRKPNVRFKRSAGRSDYGTNSIRINSGIIGKLFQFWTNQILRFNASPFPDRRKGTGSLAMRRQPGVSRS